MTITACILTVALGVWAWVRIDRWVGRQFDEA